MENTASVRQQQFQAFVRMRWVSALILTVVSLSAALLGRVSWLELRAALLLLGLVVLYSGSLHWVIWRWPCLTEERQSALKWVTLTLDMLALMVLCYFTGGVLSLYVFVPMLYIGTMAPLLGSRLVYFGATWAAALYAAGVLLTLEGVLPLTAPFGAERTPWILVYQDRTLVGSLLFLVVGLFFLGGLMGSQVAGWLSQQRQSIFQLYGAAQREARKMHLVNELARSLSGILDWPTLLGRVFDELGGLFRFDAAGLYLLEGEALRMVASRGLSTEQTLEAESTAMERHPGWVMRNQTSLLVPDTERDSRVRYLSARRSASLLMVPLVYQEQALGVLTLGSNQRGTFSREQQDLLEGIAGQLAVALANARLYRESQQMLAELRQAQERLIRSSRLAAVGEVTAALAHELNNPLGIILGNVQLTLEGLSLDPEVRQSVEAIGRATERMARLMRVLGELDLLQAEQFSVVLLDELLGEALGMLGNQLQQEGVSVHQELAPTAPPVWGSRKRLLPVLYNILLNAIEAMQGQVVPPELAISLSPGGDQVRLVVQDNGRGIPVEQLPRAFEPAFTTKVEEGRSRALGLGLFLAYYTVRAHGGNLVVDSREGVGTKVEIILPSMESWEGRLSEVVESGRIE